MVRIQIGWLIKQPLLKSCGYLVGEWRKGSIRQYIDLELHMINQIIREYMHNVVGLRSFSLLHKVLIDQSCHVCFCYTKFNITYTVLLWTF